MITMNARPGEGLPVHVRLEVTLHQRDFNDLIDKVSWMLRRNPSSGRQLGRFLRHEDSLRYFTYSARDQLPLELRILEAVAVAQTMPRGSRARTEGAS